MPTANHQTLSLRTLDDVVAEADNLAQADRAGTLTTSGNWTLGQAFGHLAAWMEYPYDGYPEGAKPPWIIKAICRLFKRRILAKPMKPGYRIPGAPGGTWGTEPMSTDAGLERLRKAAGRMASTAPAIANPIFGPMSHKEWIDMNVAHANLHLGFFTT